MKRDRPSPVSRKTSEDGVKKSFLFEPKASLKDFSSQALVFRAKRAKPWPFLITFLCQDKKVIGVLGQSPNALFI